MTQITVNDFAGSLSGLMPNANGYLQVAAKLARTGLQEYYAFELGLDEEQGYEWDDRLIVYRSPDEVFKAESLATFHPVPVTRDHPFEDVDATNSQKLANGWTTRPATRLSDFVTSDLLITTAEAVSDIQRGKRELSAGYTFVAVFSPGTTPDGEAYDILATDIHINHIAIVEEGRCGMECRAGDGKQKMKLAAADCAPCERKAEEMTVKLQTVVSDGISIEMTEQGAQAIAKVQKALDAALASSGEAAVKAAGEIKTLQETIGARDAEIAKLKADAPDAAKIEAMARDMASVAAVAIRVIGNDYKPAGVSVADMKRAVVKHSMGDAYVETMETTAVDGAYAYIASQTKDAAPMGGGQPDPFATPGRVGDKAPQDNGHSFFMDVLDGKAAN